MKKMNLVVLSVVLSLGVIEASVAAQPLTGDYVATQSTCPYLVQVSGTHPGSVIHIEAGSQSFAVGLKFPYGPNGETAFQLLLNDEGGAPYIVGHSRESGEGGFVDFDGRYTNNGNRFVATVTDEGLPNQGGTPVSRVYLEATKVTGGVSLNIIGVAKTCYLSTQN